MKFSGRSSEVHPISLQGQSISYYPNGNKNLIAVYKSNRPDGETYQYYPNGKQYIIMDYFYRDSIDTKKHKHSIADSAFKFAYDSTGKPILENGTGYFKRYNADFNTIAEEGTVKNGKAESEWKGYNGTYKISFTEKYSGGKLIDGNSVDSAGIVYSYKQRKKPAEFTTGLSGFGRYLGTTIRYPAWSREHNVQGRVVYKFIIGSDGKARDFKLMQSLDHDTDREALRVLQLMPDWIPGEYYGKKLPTSNSVPISFALQRQ